MKNYFVYMVICADGSYYIGVTNDVFLRVEKHNQGLGQKSYTFSRRPVSLVWYEQFTDPNEAISREKQIKGWSRRKKEALIKGEYGKLPTLSRSGLRQAQTDNLRQAQIDKAFILDKLPYSEPFLFVDELIAIDKTGVTGTFTFRNDFDFYRGHFTDHPVTPGVILTECCAQIGLICLGILLLGDTIIDKSLQIAFSSSEMEFLLPVYPKEKVIVISEKVYYRFQKLKCKVKMFNEKDELVCRGTLSGMLKSVIDEE